MAPHPMTPVSVTVDAGAHLAHRASNDADLLGHLFVGDGVVEVAVTEQSANDYVEALEALHEAHDQPFGWVRRQDAAPAPGPDARGRFVVDQDPVTLPPDPVIAHPELLHAGDLVCVELVSGRIVTGRLRPMNAGGLWINRQPVRIGRGDFYQRIRRVILVDPAPRRDTTGRA